MADIKDAFPFAAIVPTTGIILADRTQIVLSNYIVDANGQKIGSEEYVREPGPLELLEPSPAWANDYIQVPPGTENKNLPVETHYYSSWGLNGDRKNDVPGFSVLRLGSDDRITHARDGNRSFTQQEIVDLEEEIEKGTPLLEALQDSRKKRVYDFLMSDMRAEGQSATVAKERKTPFRRTGPKTARTLTV